MLEDPGNNIPEEASGDEQSPFPLLLLHPVVGQEVVDREVGPRVGGAAEFAPALYEFVACIRRDSPTVTQGREVVGVTNVSKHGEQGIVTGDMEFLGKLPVAVTLDFDEGVNVATHNDRPFCRSTRRLLLVERFRAPSCYIT